MSEKRLCQLAKTFLFRKKMSETLNQIENEIRASLLNEEKNQMMTGGFKILMKEDGQIEIIELPPINLEQLDLPLTSHQENPKKGEQK